MIDKEKWKKWCKVILSLDNHPAHISAGLAVGVFISFTPFFGFHTTLALLAAFILKLNKVTCVAGAWVNTPLTMMPIFALSYKLGHFLLGLPPREFHLKGLEWQHLKGYAASILLGTSILGFIAAVTAYSFSYYLIIKFRQKDETLAEMTQEMKETGEDLE